MKNPFYLRALPIDAPFCDRTRELDELVSHSRNKANVVLVSPRRYGKTSLVRRVQERLQKEGVVTLYLDFMGVDSVEDLAGRVASRFYAYSYVEETLFKKAIRFITSWRPVVRPDPEYGVSISVERISQRKGLDLLSDTLESFGKFILESKRGIHIVFDEFQEIVDLPQSIQIEGILRSHIQTHSNASYFFVGSRRRILNDMFNMRKRPFYRSSINYPLAPLPLEEGTHFIIEQFRQGGKSCPETIAQKIYEKTEGYPYYIQRMPYAIFEASRKKITEDDYNRGFQKMLEEEAVIFEAMVQGLSIQQIRLISALAQEPTGKPYSVNYMASYGLGSIGGVQGAMKRLLELDYIEKRNNTLRIVDPVFGIWLSRLKASGALTR